MIEPYVNQKTKSNGMVSNRCFQEWAWAAAKPESERFRAGCDRLWSSTWTDFIFWTKTKTCFETLFWNNNCVKIKINWTFHEATAWFWMWFWNLDWSMLYQGLMTQWIKSNESSCQSDLNRELSRRVNLATRWNKSYPILEMHCIEHACMMKFWILSMMNHAWKYVNFGELLNPTRRVRVSTW